MREIIFKNTGPRLVFSSAGRLKQLRTGSDSYCEHNDAAEQLASKVCEGFSAGPAISDMYRISKPQLLEFVALPENESGVVEAVLGANLPGGHAFTASELPSVGAPSVLRALETFHDDVAAALAWGNFAIRVRGSAKAKALAQFHAAILAGDVVVVPCERNHYNCSGVALVNLKELTDDERVLLETDTQAFLQLSFGK